MQVRFSRCSPLFLLVFVTSHFLFSQNQAPVSDPHAVALATRAVTALTGGTAVSDVTLTGNATWIAGSDLETGSANLQAKGTGESRVDLNLSDGTRTEIRNDTGSYPQGASVINGGDQQAWPAHNCWINASWFFPALSFLNTAADPSLIFSYIGEENRGGAKVEHLQVYRYLAAQRPASISLTQRVSTTDFYLDSSSLLPVAVTFNTHASDDAFTNIALEIDFSKYRQVGGVQVPFHIQKLVWGGLAVDITVQTVALNSGLSDGLFSIPQRPE
jgi:hypothetical protein